MRNRYLVAYDITEDRRLRAVHRCMTGFGQWVQYSVFVCDLNERELIRLRTALRRLLDHGSDAVMIVDLGPADARGTNCFEFMGVRRQLPSGGGATIV